MTVRNARVAAGDSGILRAERIQVEIGLESAFVIGAAQDDLVGDHQAY